MLKGRLDGLSKTPLRNTSDTDMKRWAKRALALASGLVGLSVLLVAAVLLLVEVPSDLCGNALQEQVLSPNNKMKAVIFERDCGATTGFITHVSVMPVDAALENEGGNVFVADFGKLRGSSPTLRVKWISDARLQIAHDQTVDVVRAESRAKGIHLEYTDVRRVAGE